MNFIPSFFTRFDPNKPLSIPTIEPNSKIENEIDTFLKTKLDAITTVQLDKLATTILENPLNPDSFDAPKIYELTIKNQKAIEQLLKLCEVQQDPTSTLYQSFEKIEKIIQALLKINEALIQSSMLRFSEKELTKASIEVGKLLGKAKPNNFKNWSGVANTSNKRISKNRNAEKISIESFKEYKTDIEQKLNSLRENQPTDENKPPHPRPK